MSQMNETDQIRLPGSNTMQHASKICIAEDKPMMLDYWKPSLEKSVIIGVREEGEKLLVKSEDEYTSSIVKIFKVESDYIVLTENSLYIVDINCPTKRIS
jgi:hypothetical protein